LTTVLFICDSAPKFSTIRELAARLSTKNEFHSIVFVPEYDGDIEHLKKFCGDKNISLFQSLTKYSSTQYFSSFNILLGLTFRLRRLFPLLYKIFFYKHQIKQCSNFLSTNQISTLVTCEDNTGVALSFVRAAADSLVRSVVIPFTIANVEEVAFSYKTRRKNIMKSPWQKIFFSFFRKWKFRFAENEYFFEAPREIIAQYACHMSPINPLLSVGGRSDCVLFESEFMRDYYLRSGCPKNLSSVVCGSLKLDIFHELFENQLENNKKLLEDLGLGIKPIILCALPPDYYPNSEYKDHLEIIIDWVRVLCSVNSHHTIVSLHPRTSPEIAIHVAALGASVLDRPIDQAIPFCDLFVASVSATIRFAIACGKRVLNFDIFGMDYSEYYDIPLVATVSTRKSFARELVRLTSHNTMVKRIQPHYFGKLDGQSYSRIETHLTGPTQS
jgi:hypothetical protein